MAYEPTEWSCGDTITAEKMNNIEEGVQEALECCGGGSSDIFVVNYNADASYNVTSDKTFAEIKDAYDNDQTIIAHVTADFIPGIVLTAVSLEYIDDYGEQCMFSFLRPYSCPGGGYALQDFHVTHYGDDNIVPGYADILSCQA